MAYNDTVRQTIEVLVQAEGIDAFAAIQTALRKTQENMRDVTERFIEQGGPIRDLIPILADLSGEYQRLTKISETMQGRQNALAESFVGLPQITQQAGALADSLTKVDVSLNGLMSSAFKVRGDEITATLQAQAEAARLVEKVEGDAMRARIEGYARAEQATKSFQDSLEALAGRDKAIADQVKADARATADAVVAAEQRMGAEKRARIEAFARAEQAAEADAIALQKAATASDALAGREVWLKQQTDALAEALKGLAASEATQATAKMGTAFQLTERQIGGLSRGLLEFSRGLEDFTVAGPIGALNNIPGIFRAIGDSMQLPISTVNALTAAVSISATGAYVLYKNWDTLKETFGVGIARPAIEGIKGLEDQLKKASHETEELEKKTRLNITEMDQYDKAKAKVKELTEELKRQKEIKDLLDGKSKAERETGSGFKEAVAESGGGAAMDGLIEALQARMDAKGKVIDPTTGRSETPQRAAENMMREAAGGDKGARDAIVKTLQDVFGDKSGFAKNIIEASPERKAAEKRREAANDEEERALKEQHDRTKEKEAAREVDRDAEEKGIKGTVDAKKDRAKVAADEAKAADKDLKAGEKEQREREVAAKKFTPTFEGRIQAEMLENARRLAEGHIVARTPVDFQALTMQGLQPAVPPEMLRADLEQRIGRDLRRVGGKNVDPTLSHEVVGQAGKHLDERAAKLAGNQATTMNDVADNQALIAALIEQGMMATMRAQGQARAANGHLRRLAQQGPNLGRRGN